MNKYKDEIIIILFLVFLAFTLLACGEGGQYDCPAECEEVIVNTPQIEDDYENKLETSSNN